MKNNECQYNHGVVCNSAKSKCDGCGWNPEVARARLKCYCTTNGGQIPHQKKKS